MTDYDAVVFDNDGVLVELTDIEVLRTAARDAFADVGIDSPAERFVDNAVGGKLDGLAAMEDEHGVPVEEFWAAREQRAIERQREAIENGGKPLFDDVAALRELPQRLGVVSNNQHATVEFIVDHYGLGDLFETVHGREPTYEGAVRRKPETDYLDEALDVLGTRDALYVGDSPKDVTTAHRAGLDAAFVRRPHRRPADVDREPTYRVESLRELVDRLVE